MKCITLHLIIMLFLISTMSSAMVLDMKDIKYQQMFFYNVEAPLKVSEFPMFLEFNNMVAAKNSLLALDKDKQNMGLIKKAISDLSNAMLLMTYKQQDLLLSERNTPENRALFQSIFENLDWISQKLFKKMDKVSKSQTLSEQSAAASPVQQTVPYFAEARRRSTEHTGLVWQEIAENILGDNFVGHVQAINEKMKEYVQNRNCHDSLDEVLRILSGMETEINTLIPPKEIDDVLYHFKKMRSDIEKCIA